MIKKFLFIIFTFSSFCLSWTNSEIDDFKSKIKELNNLIPKSEDITCDNIAAINMSGTETFTTKILNIEQDLQDLLSKFGKFKNSINEKITQECDHVVVQVVKEVEVGVS